MSALALEGDGDEGPGQPNHAVARELCGQLNDLALRYWSEGRPADAIRVAMEATAILDSFEPPSELMAEVRATVDALERELLGPPGQDPHSE